MSATRVLFDEPGPRGRRRTLVGSVLVGVAMVAVFYLGLANLADTGELAVAKWKPFWQRWAVAFLLEGLWGTLLVTVVSAVLCFPAGGLLAVGRAGRNPVVRWFCTAYIEVFRSVPTLLLVFVFLFALPGAGINLPIFWMLALPIAMGMTPAKAMRLVIMPQAVGR